MAAIFVADMTPGGGEGVRFRRGSCLCGVWGSSPIMGGRGGGWTGGGGGSSISIGAGAWSLPLVLRSFGWLLVVSVLPPVAWLPGFGLRGRVWCARVLVLVLVLGVLAGKALPRWFG